MKTALLVLAAALAATPAYADHRCGTLDHLPEIEARWHLAPRTAAAHHGPKQVRDSFAGTWETLQSDNFVVRWKAGAVLPANAQKVLDVLELSWTTYHDTLQQDVPIGADQFKVNAYVVGPDDTPSIEFDGGYASLDSNGYPYFVLSLGMFASSSPTAVAAMEAVTAHEYYHDVQFTSGAFRSYSWIFESTAEWGAMSAIPDNNGPFDYAGPFIMTSNYALFHFGNPLNQSLDGLHPYGAGMFWRFVTDTLDDKSIVVEAWDNGVPGQEPLRQIFGNTTATTLDASFQDFVEHAAFLDFPAAYRNKLFRSLQGFSTTPETAHIKAYIPAAGVPMTTFDDRIQSYGWVTFELAKPATGFADIELALTGAEQVPSAALHASVVRSTATGFVTEELAVSGTSSTVTVDFDASALVTRLVVWVSSDERVNGKVFGLNYKVTPSDGEDPGDGDDTTDGDDATDADDAASDGTGDADDGGGCCSSSRSLPGSLALSIVGLAFLRRRRPR